MLAFGVYELESAGGRSINDTVKVKVKATSALR